MSLEDRQRIKLVWSGHEGADKESAPAGVVAPRLQKLLDGQLADLQKDKIKIAFAEGYIAGKHYYHFHVARKELRVPFNI